MFPWKYPNIEAERAKRNWSKSYLAGQLKISAPTYRDWITRGGIPSNKLEEMATIFGCSVSYLLGSGLVENKTA